ncbi:hypothetical protein BI350_08980 [Sporosarcina ureilytica]|uniref:Uncharacterized protein n=2 Tax=Sporosarcina ureilytica TaxID=298596 RepID=A0A1D8JG40_9BACL|nr:hypothetical protein BI350_08980 [Sporosarcina ureilytica]
MIYTTGFVTLITNAKAKRMNNFKSNTLTLEFMEDVIDEASLKMKYRYTAFLPRSYECQTLEDYTGKIKPFIQSQIPSMIVSLQVIHLNYVSERARRNFRR